MESTFTYNYISQFNEQQNAVQNNIIGSTDLYQNQQTGQINIKNVDIQKIQNTFDADNTKKIIVQYQNKQLDPTDSQAGYLYGNRWQQLDNTLFSDNDSNGQPVQQYNIIVKDYLGWKYDNIVNNILQYSLSVQKLFFNGAYKILASNISGQAQESSLQTLINNTDYVQNQGINFVQLNVSKNNILSLFLNSIIQLSDIVASGSNANLYYFSKNGTNQYKQIEYNEINNTPSIPNIVPHFLYNNQDKQYITDTDIVDLTISPQKIYNGNADTSKYYFLVSYYDNAKWNNIFTLGYSSVINSFLVDNAISINKLQLGSGQNQLLRYNYTNNNVEWVNQTSLVVTLNALLSALNNQSSVHINTQVDDTVLQYCLYCQLNNGAVSKIQYNSLSSKKYLRSYSNTSSFEQIQYSDINVPDGSIGIQKLVTGNPYYSLQYNSSGVLTSTQYISNNNIQNNTVNINKLACTQQKSLIYNSGLDTTVQQLASQNSSYYLRGDLSFQLISSLNIPTLQGIVNTINSANQAYIFGSQITLANTGYYLCYNQNSNQIGQFALDNTGTQKFLSCTSNVLSWQIPSTTIADNSISLSKIQYSNATTPSKFLRAQNGTSAIWDSITIANLNLNARDITSNYLKTDIIYTNSVLWYSIGNSNGGVSFISIPGNTSTFLRGDGSFQNISLLNLPTCNQYDFIFRNTSGSGSFEQGQLNDNAFPAGLISYNKLKNDSVSSYKVLGTNNQNSISLFSLTNNHLTDNTISLSKLVNTSNNYRFLGAVSSGVITQLQLSDILALGNQSSNNLYVNTSSNKDINLSAGLSFNFWDDTYTYNPCTIDQTNLTYYQRSNTTANKNKGIIYKNNVMISQDADLLVGMTCGKQLQEQNSYGGWNSDQATPVLWAQHYANDYIGRFMGWMYNISNSYNTMQLHNYGGNSNSFIYDDASRIVVGTYQSYYDWSYYFSNSGVLFTRSNRELKNSIRNKMDDNTINERIKKLKFYTYKRKPMFNAHEIVKCNEQGCKNTIDKCQEHKYNKKNMDEKSRIIFKQNQHQIGVMQDELQSLFKNCCGQKLYDDIDIDDKEYVDHYMQNNYTEMGGVQYELLYKYFMIGYIQHLKQYEKDLQNIKEQLQEQNKIIQEIKTHTYTQKSQSSMSQDVLQFLQSN